MTAIWAAIVTCACAAASIAVGAIFTFRRAGFARRAVVTEGTVTAIDAESSGHFPVVTFSAADRAITFRSRHGGQGQRVGQRVPVYYDPQSPQVASIGPPRSPALVAAGTIGGGLLLLPVAATLGLYVAPLEASRDRAVDEFIAAARGGDSAAVRARSAPDALVDGDLVHEALPSSTGFDRTDDLIGFDHTACVRGVLLPQKIPMVLALVRDPDGEWKVQRAARQDEECDSRLND